MDLFIAGIARAGTTLLSNLLTSPPDRLVLVEPGLTRHDMGDHVRQQVERFGLPRSWDTWSGPRGETALDRFERCLRPSLNQIRWGVKEVNPLGWDALVQIFEPKKIVLCVRDMRDCAISMFEKHRRSSLPGQDEAWISRRLVDASEALLTVKRSSSASRVRVIRYEDLVTDCAERARLETWLDWPLNGDPAWCMDLYGRQHESARHDGMIGSSSVHRAAKTRTADATAFASSVVTLTQGYQAEFGYSAAA